MACVDKTQLIELQKKHVTDAGIAMVLNISRQAVHQLRAKYGIKAIRNRNAERNARIVALYKSGKTGIAIAKILDLAQAQVYRLVKDS